VDAAQPLPAVARPVRRPVWPAGRVPDHRPSGQDRQPSPRVRREVWAWAAVFVAALGCLVLLPVITGPGSVVEQLDRAISEALGGPSVAADLDGLAVLGYRAVWIPCALVLAWFARWRELMVYLGTISVVAATAQVLAGEARLAQVVRIGVTGSAEVVVVPAWPVIVLSTVATATLFALVPGGRARRWGWVVVLTGIAVMAAVRVANGLSGSSASVASAAVGCSAAALAFHLLAPEAEFPVVYRRRVKAHLQLDAARTHRITAAVRAQLGVELTGLHAYRLDGSTGSTPCRLEVSGAEVDTLFGKLYATTHLRSDRWYKLARVLRYGRLEDEAPFASVRRLAEHEDYMLRLLRDGGVRVPAPVGVVEVVPGREYLLVTEFVPRSAEILESEVTDEVVDDALLQIRRLWQAGAAHRDIKPSNVLVQGEHVVLIDVSFGELRPSRWRQSVDLANMLLVLALAAGPERVLERATRFFEPDELAEAFATTSSLTVPRQLRRMLADTEGDLVQTFCRLLPPRPRINVQRWSTRRVLLALATVGGVVLAAVTIAVNLRAGGLL
jgi:tRNA A-37 threonylcarbamoyl transferase component Bud32